MAYFDNAATTYPKPESVYKFMDEFYRANGGNSGRGSYALAQNAGELTNKTRQLICELLHCPNKQVIFEPSDTIALNIIIQGLIQMGKHNIYITPFEHNAVTRTLYYFEKNNVVEVKELYVSKDLKYDLERIKYQFDEFKPDVVIASHASNVCGLVAPVEDIFAMAKKYDAVTVVDMAQTAGLVDCNIGLETFDFAVFAGHKNLYAPTGISGFVMKPDIDMPVVLFGGTGIESANQDMPKTLPQRYEMGTSNISGIAGLYAALNWIKEKTLPVLWQHEQETRNKLLELLQEYDFIDIIGNVSGSKYVGIVSCNIQGISSESAGEILAKHNIAVRTGLHCAPLAHKFLGTFPSGTIRFSGCWFTNEDDFIVLRSVLDFVEESL